jgi:hypothetical protein
MVLEKRVSVAVVCYTPSTQGVLTLVTLPPDLRLYVTVSTRNCFLNFRNFRHPLYQFEPQQFARMGLVVGGMAVGAH